MKVLCNVEYCFFNKYDALVILDEFEDNEEATHVRLRLDTVKLEVLTNNRNVSELVYTKSDCIRKTELFNLKEYIYEKIFLEFDGTTWVHRIGGDKNYDVFIANRILEI